MPIIPPYNAKLRQGTEGLGRNKMAGTSAKVKRKAANNSGGHLPKASFDCDEVGTLDAGDSEAKKKMVQ